MYDEPQQDHKTATNQDNDLRTALCSAQQSVQGSVASFDATWEAAQRSSERRRRLMLARNFGLAASVVAVIALALLSSSDDSTQYVDVDELMGSTSWTAPSDILLPERRYDIYQEIPSLFESTESTGGTLL